MRGKFLVTMRKAACMTQAHLARASGVSERTLRRAERGGDVGPESLRALCAVLGVPAAGVAGMTDAPGIPDVTFEGDWTRERHTRAVSLWMQGHSGASIAADLGQGFTRNRVICRMFRAGLAFCGGERGTSSTVLPRA